MNQSDRWLKQLEEKDRLDKVEQVAREKAKQHNLGQPPSPEDVVAFLLHELGIR